jgi:hypothetical protein
VTSATYTQNIKKQQRTDYYKLTVQDRKDFILSIDQRKIRTPHDTVINNKKYTLVYVPLRLSNRSKDTLKYIAMTCSWYDQYQINNNKLWIFNRGGCDSNFPIEKVVVPNKASILNIPIALMQGSTKEERFRIGMNLFISRKKNQDFLFDSAAKYQTANLIWSNEVKMP